MTTESFTRETWIATVLKDDRIPAGKAMSVVKGIGGQIYWPSRKLLPAVTVLAARLDVTEDFVKDVVAYLAAIGYLADSGRRNKRRTIYVPTLPATALQRQPAATAELSVEEDEHAAAA